MQIKPLREEAVFKIIKTRRFHTRVGYTTNIVLSVDKTKSFVLSTAQHATLYGNV